MKYTKFNKNYSKFKNKSDEDEEDVPLENHLGYSERSRVSTQVKVYLDEFIESPKYYRGVFDKVISLGEEDQVVYFVSSKGGRMDGLITLIEANRQCNAEVLCVIIGECHSAASMFALTCENISVSPSATMMVHYVSFGTGGKGSDVRANVNHTLQFTEDYFRDIYEGFLTNEEIDICINTGKELWMQSNEIISRLELRQKYLLELEKEESPNMEFPTTEDQLVEEKPKKTIKKKP